jgi:hypothetical protein
MSTGRVSLAYRDLVELSPALVAELSKSCKILDLTSNQISDLSPLRDVPNLEELILDDNKITSHTKFPPLPKLQNLWVNRNQINSLTSFIDKLVASCPNLIMLSMLNNEACPNYFNSGTPAQYQDYRYYVVNRMPKLQLLDSTAVSPTEKAEAQAKYGKLASTTESEAIRRAAEAAVAAKKRAEREMRAQEKAEEIVLKRQEDRKAAKRAKRRPSPSMPSTAPPPPPFPSKLAMDNQLSEPASQAGVESTGELLRSSSLDPAEGIRVLPPLPNRPPPTKSVPSDDDWSSGDDDWSSSSDM